MSSVKIILISFITLIYCTGNAQVDCNTLDVNKVPGRWVWDKRGGGDKPIPATQWQFAEPIRKEMQRIMPVVLDGLYVTNSIAMGEQAAFWYTKGPNSYENYLMLKDYECLKGYNELKPEALTGCWVYFSVNHLEGEKFPLPEQGTGVHFNESSIRVTNIEVHKDAAGNKVIYSNYKPAVTIKHCFYFSARKELPWRKLINQELFTAYKIHHEKRVKQEVGRFEKLVADDEKKYNGLSAAEKQKQHYWPDIIKKNKETLQNYRTEQQKIINWYNEAIKQSNSHAIAYVTSINESHFYPERLVATPGNGYNAWVDNLDFFDKTKPTDEPQCIALYIRRQDADLPKKNFMDLFHSQFNLDVLANMVGESAKKPHSINTLNTSLGEAKIATKTNQSANSNYQYGFEQSTLNQFPSGWNGMKNISVQQYENKKWLAFTKDGYWYPKQYNKEIKDNFDLLFELSWNKDIAYNSGAFTVAIAEVDYDNTSERYRLDDNQNMYWSLYDSYVGKFSRVMLWFDPYWNGSGTLTVYSYDKNETVGVNKRIPLPEFYNAKNQHRLKIQRKGNSLVVYINDKKEAEIDNVFIPSVKYNLYTFSRYKGNNSDNKNDVFYLDNIITNY